MVSITPSILEQSQLSVLTNAKPTETTLFYLREHADSGIQNQPLSETEKMWKWKSLSHVRLFEIGMKIDLFQSVDTAEFSKFTGILSAALSQNHLPGFEIAQLEFHHLH